MVDSVEETPALGQRTRVAERNPGPTVMGDQGRARPRRERSRSRSTTPRRGRRRIEVETTESPQDQPPEQQEVREEAPVQPLDQAGRAEGHDEVAGGRPDIRTGGYHSDSDVEDGDHHPRASTSWGGAGTARRAPTLEWKFAILLG